MIIDGKSIRGIYVYSEETRNIEYEKNDFVVSGECIYLCTAENPTNPIRGTVSGIDPADDLGQENFILYPGSRIQSATEFFQFVESGKEIGDKYVSSQAIMGILQGYQFGVGMTGVIEDYIDREGNSSLNLDNVTNNPLDNLMLTQTLNNGVIKVSHELKQIVDGELEGKSFSILFGYMEQDVPIEYNLLLHQYTYKQSSTGYVRIQEMSSPLPGVSIYRFITWTEDNFPETNTVISSWRSVYSYSSTVMDKLNALDEFYTDAENRCRAKIDSLRGLFRFKDESAGIDSEGRTFIIPKEDKGKVYTLCLRDNNQHQESVTVKTNLSFPITINFNYLSGWITVAEEGDGLSISVGGAISIKIIDVYKRETLPVI